MIHALFDLISIGFDVIAAWLKQDLGAADYRIVRLLFFSAFGAWVAFTLARVATGMAHGILRLVTYRIPRTAFQLFCRVGRLLEAACVRFEPQCREWLAAKKRPDHGL